MSSLIALLLLVSCVDLSICRPAEEPTKISFNIEKQHTVYGEGSKITSAIQQGKDFVGQIADGVRFGRGRLVNSLTVAKNIIADRAEMFASEARNNVASVIAAKADAISQKRSIFESLQNALPARSLPTGRENVRLEKEGAQGFLEKPLQKRVEEALGMIVKPVPLVDRIKEEEKYGNSGDKFAGVGRALVNGYEGFSNFLNTLVSIPGNIFKQTARGLTEKLNHVGGQLVGLE